MAIKTNFADYSVYEVTSPAPEHQRGWYWELKSTYESAGPFHYGEAVEGGRIRAAEVRKANEK